MIELLLILVLVISLFLAVPLLSSQMQDPNKNNKNKNKKYYYTIISLCKIVSRDKIFLKTNINHIFQLKSLNVEYENRLQE